MTVNILFHWRNWRCTRPAKVRTVHPLPGSRRESRANATVGALADSSCGVCSPFVLRNCVSQLPTFDGTVRAVASSVANPCCRSPAGPALTSMLSWLILVPPLLCCWSPMMALCPRSVRTLTPGILPALRQYPCCCHDVRVRAVSPLL